MYINASIYNYDTLSMFAKITPRFIFLSSVKNSIKEEVKLCIVSDNIKNKEVLYLSHNIPIYYPHGIQSMPLKIISISYNDLLKNSKNCNDAQILFLFNSTNKHIEESVKYAKSHTILTTSYDANLLNNGVDISLYLGRKIVPYINIKSIKEKGITLNNTILGLSKIFTEVLK